MPWDLPLEAKNYFCEYTGNKMHFPGDFLQPNRFATSHCMLSHLAAKHASIETTTNKPGVQQRNRQAFLDIFRASISYAFQLDSLPIFSVISRFNFFVGTTTRLRLKIKGSGGKTITALHCYRTDRLIIWWQSPFTMI